MKIRYTFPVDTELIGRAKGLVVEGTYPVKNTGGVRLDGLIRPVLGSNMVADADE
jgi:hypothetical protein